MTTNLSENGIVMIGYPVFVDLPGVKAFSTKEKIRFLSEIYLIDYFSACLSVHQACHLFQFCTYCTHPSIGAAFMIRMTDWGVVRTGISKSWFGRFISAKQKKLGVPLVPDQHILLRVVLYQ